MAWYAELKRRHWYSIIGINMIFWYKEKLYKDWLESLTDEQRETLKKRQEEQKKEYEALRTKDIIRLLNLTANMYSSLYRRWY